MSRSWLRSGWVSAHYFDIFGVKPAMGRGFLPGEDQPGKDHVVVLAHALWENSIRLGSPASLGAGWSLDNQPYTVVGVLPRGSAFDRAFN